MTTSAYMQARCFRPEHVYCTAVKTLRIDQPTRRKKIVQIARTKFVTVSISKLFVIILEIDQTATNNKDTIFVPSIGNRKKLWVSLQLKIIALCPASVKKQNKMYLNIV